MVLPARDEVSRILTGGRTTLAVRIPDQDLAREVISRFGGAVALTSANVHGEQEARSAAEVSAVFGERVAAVVDGGPSKFGEPSTIISLPADGSPEVLRPGAVDEQLVLEALSQT